MTSSLYRPLSVAPILLHWLTQNGDDHLMKTEEVTNPFSSVYELNMHNLEPLFGPITLMAILIKSLVKNGQAVVHQRNHGALSR